MQLTPGISLRWRDGWQIDRSGGLCVRGAAATTTRKTLEKLGGSSSSNVSSTNCSRSRSPPPLPPRQHTHTRSRARTHTHTHTRTHTHIAITPHETKHADAHVHTHRTKLCVSYRSGLALGRLQARANEQRYETFNASLSTTWVGVDDSAAKQSSWQLWQRHTCQSKLVFDSLTSLGTRCQVTECHARRSRPERAAERECTFTTPCPTRQRVALSNSSVCIACMLPVKGWNSRSTTWTDRFLQRQACLPIPRRPRSILRPAPPCPFIKKGGSCKRRVKVHCTLEDTRIHVCWGTAIARGRPRNCRPAH